MSGSNVHAFPDVARDALPSSISVVPARFVTIELAAVVTGLSPGAIRTKIARSIWLEDRQYVRRDGRVLIDLKGYEKWAESGAE
jgi:hypothetical protein